MFLIIDEFNDIYTSLEMTDVIRMQWEDGLISIVDITDISDPKEYSHEEWRSIDLFPTDDDKNE